MNTASTRFTIAVAILALAACGRSEAPAAMDRPADVATATAALTSCTPTWELDDESGYSFSCADECGVPNCSCITLCDVSVGQPCATVGASCNRQIATSQYQVMTCVAPTSIPPPTWTRVSTSSCADECGVTNCNCISNRCVGNPEGQTCSNINASCNVVSGPSYFELVCISPCS